MDFNNNERNNQDPNKRKKNKTNLLICLMAALFAIGLIFFLNSEIQRNTEKEITYTKFIEMLKKDQVKKVTFQSNMIVIEPAPLCGVRPCLFRERCARTADAPDKRRPDTCQEAEWPRRSSCR